MPMATSLLTTDGHNFGLASRDLKVTYKGEALTTPHVIRLRMDSQSRKDITDDDFNEKRPFVLDVGARIFGIVGNQGQAVPSGKLLVSGSTVQIKPMLIKRGPVFELDLLVDGQPRLSYVPSLRDVEVKEQDRAKVQRQRALILAICGLLLVIIPSIFAIKAYLAHGAQSSGVSSVADGPGGFALPNMPASDLYTTMFINRNVLAIPGIFAEVGAQFNVNGVADNIPSGDDLWLVANPTKTNRWYPLGQLILETGGKWDMRIDVNEALKGSSMNLDVVMLPASDKAAYVRSGRIGGLQHLPQGLSKLPRGSQIVSTFPIVVQ